MNKRRRPWKVHVRDIGPNFSFATRRAAERRARELLVAPHSYATVDVYDVNQFPPERIVFRHDDAEQPTKQVWQHGWKNKQEVTS